ncbi:MAG: aminomethyltransferase family protein, partial [Actinomycetota bacterium]
LKTSPVYPWHRDADAVFGEKAGWERVNYYQSHATDDGLRPYGWAGKYWSSAIATEHHATRNSAGLFDESSFAKFTVTGERAGEFLNIVCANNVVRGVGRAVYTQALNTRGGIECDFTVTQTGEHSFFIVTGTAFGTHDLGWLKKQRRELDYPEVQLDDVTGAYACFGLWGPKAPEILSGITPTDVSNEAFRFLHSREITVGDIPVRATRITYVGELGWEMYVSTEYGAALWQVLLEAGAPHQLMACGYKAIDSLRLEKGYRAWGGEVNSETTPWEAGLGFAVALGKENFIGRDALVASQGKETKKLVALHFDDIRRVPLGNEPIRIGDEIVGRVKSGGQGFTLGKSIGYGYLPIEHSQPGTAVEVEFFGEWVSGVVA